MSDKISDVMCHPDAREDLGEGYEWPAVGAEEAEEEVVEDAGDSSTIRRGAGDA